MKLKILLLLLLSSVILAQSSATIISGVVQDKKSTPLPACNIYLEGTIDGAVSDNDGYFRFTSNSRGKKTLICDYLGYQSFQKEIHLTPGDTIRLVITLKESSIAGKAVTVNASVFSSGEKEGVTLTPLEVVTTPGAAADIFWAIKTFPGLQQVDEGAGLFVRGGDVSETAVIIDGAYLNHPYRYESPNGGYFGTITPFLLQETFFSSGGFSAEYGNALSGALIMESVDLPQQRQTTIGLGLAAASGSVSLPVISEKLGFSLSGNYSDTERMFKFNGHQREFSRYPQAYDLNFNGVYRYSPKGAFKLFLFRESDKVGIELQNPDENQFYRGDGLNNLANLRWRHIPSEKWYFTANLAFSNFAQNQNLGVLDLTTDERLYQVRFIAEHRPNDKLTARIGVEAFRNQVLIEGQVPEKRDDISVNALPLQVDTDYLSNRIAAFLQSEIWMLDGNLKLTLGSRFERDSQSQQRLWNGRTALSYGLGNDWHAVLSAGAYHQFPRPDYYDPYIGNPNLQAMSANHYIAGVVRQTPREIFRIEAYRKNYNRLLLEDLQRNYTNNGFGFAKGLDLFYKRNWQAFLGWISYSYLDAERFWQDAPYAASPRFDITHNLTAVGELSFALRWRMGISYRYATGKPYTDGPAVYHNARTPDYHKVDANLSYVRSFFGNNMTVFYLAASNLLGRENIFDYTYSEDFQRRVAVKSSMRRSVYFGVSINF